MIPGNIYVYAYETYVYEYVYEYVYKDTIPHNRVRRPEDKHKIEDTYKYDMRAYIPILTYVYILEYETYIQRSDTRE